MSHQICQENLQEAWAALTMIRETVETFAPPGSVTNAEYLGPEFMQEAEAIVRGIRAMAEFIPDTPRGAT